MFFFLLFLCTTFLNLTPRCRHFFLIVIQVHPFKRKGGKTLAD